MKVVHINTYDGNGGAGRACLRLSKALVQQGVGSEVWVYYKFGKIPLIQSFSNSPLKKAFAAFGILFERYTSSAFTKKLKIPFSIPLWGTDISKHPALLEADIIHIHWINHAFLRPRDLAKLQKLNKPLVWTFHDNNAFTGGCHVRYGCNHFENECGNCPILKNSHNNDISHKIWLSKNRAYQQLEISVVTPSNWMGAAVKRSKLLSRVNVNVIPNTLETAIFKPFDKENAKRHLGLSPDKFILLSGFMPSKNDLHKGAPYLVEAISILIAKNLIPAEKTELVVFGNRDNKNVPEFPIKTTYLGTISNDDNMAICYSAADVFLVPSLEDNLPNTVMESLACGTPIVAFDISGLPDLVNHKENGYLAAYKSSEDFANGISWVYHHPERIKLQSTARRTVEERFSETVVANKHIELYKKLLSPKTDAENQPSLSVITVVYNNVKDIERTVQSVINQTYPNIEYIIIDGASTDGTLDILAKYQNRIQQQVSEKDDGIYDAMNKGLALATGDYVLFMNSGDEIYANNTVENVFASAPDADIYYGETEMFNQKWESLGQRRHRVPDELTKKSFKYGMSVSHQAIYIRRSLIKPYNTEYQLSADIDWILSALQKATKVVNTRMYVAKYLVGGMSKKKHKKSLIERFRIFTKYYGLIPNLLHHVVITSKMFVYYLKNGRTND